MNTLFVTASGTGVGKTLVIAALTHQLRRAGSDVRTIKPVISGFDATTQADSDTAVILASLGAAATPAAIDTVSPWRFTAPLSPDMAARREGRALDLAALVGFCRDAAAGPEDHLLIEGVGGVMVPLNDGETVLDWMAALAAPAAIVTGSYLGTVSHTLTSVAAVRARRIAITGIVISESEESPVAPAETQATIRRFAPDIPVVVLPRLIGPKPWTDAPDLTPLLHVS